PARPHEVARWLRVALTSDDHQRWSSDYTFHDLISLRVVHELVVAGVKPRQIRAAEIHFGERLGVARPFATEQVYTDGVNILYRAAPEVAEQMTAANLSGQ